MTRLVPDVEALAKSYYEYFNGNADPDTVYSWDWLVMDSELHSEGAGAVITRNFREKARSTLSVSFFRRLM